MKRYPILFTLAIAVFLSSCEIPSEPKLKLNQRTNIPLVINKKFEFMGGANALIDTNNADFSDLFEIASDGLVKIVQEVDFSLGEFDTAIPQIDVDPVTINVEIGELSVDDFTASFSSNIGEIEAAGESTDPESAQVGTFNATFSGSGSASYQDITGNDPNTVPSGTPIPGATDVEVFIDIDGGDFQQAVIQSGGLKVTMVNNMGFTLSSVTATLIANSIEFPDNDNQSNFAHGDSRELFFDFQDNDVLEVPFQIRVLLSWEAQVTQANAGNLDITEAADNELVVKSATASIPAQVINPETPNLEINNDGFVYAIVSNDETGVNNILTLTLENNTSLSLTDSTFSTPPTITLRNSDNEILDATKVFSVESDPSATSIGPGQTGSISIDLSGQRLTKILSYTINIGTPGGNSLTVNSSDFFVFSSSTSTLVFQEANTTVDPQSDITLEDTNTVEGDFVNAEVDSGSLFISFENQSPIPIVVDQLTIFNTNSFRAKNSGNFFAAGSEIATITNLTIPANGTTSETLEISGKGISNSISYSGTSSSPGSTAAVTLTAEDLLNITVEGSVSLQSATAVLDPQRFDTSGEIDIASDEFQLLNDDHYVGIKAGLINITRIINNIDLDVDTLRISFPTILSDPNQDGMFNESDSLVIQFSGSNKILRSSAGVNRSLEIDLANTRIYAKDNKLVYNVLGVTENTRIINGPDSVRTVFSTDYVDAEVEITGLQIQSARGFVAVRTIRLNNEPDSGDASLDLYNDAVVEKTELSDLEVLSKRLSEISFFNPNFNLFYNTNIGVDTDVYAAILGVSDQGNEVYLKGKNNSDFVVPALDTIGGFFNRSVSVPSDDMIRFRIRGTDQFGELSEDRSIIFDANNSNVDEFLSNLPTEIRFVGKALVNPGSEEGFVTDPVEIITNMGIDIPINLATPNNPGISTDTIDVDLSDLPGEGDDIQLKKFTITLKYENQLPFEIDLSLGFLDSLDVKNIELPAFNDDRYIISAASVDPVTKFTSAATAGILKISMNEQQLNILNTTRKLELVISFSTSENQEVKVRSTDFIVLGLEADVEFQINTGN